MDINQLPIKVFINHVLYYINLICITLYLLTFLQQQQNHATPNF